MLIAYILAALVATAGYLFMGLNLADKMPLDTVQYYLFWAAYMMFGLSIATVLFLGKAWQILQDKQGPVGPRGYRGDTGATGTRGECFEEQYIIAIKRETLAAIADVLQQTGISIKPEQVYDSDRLRLVNRYLDMRFQRQLDSQQLRTLMAAGIKTTGEVATYISGLWTSWVAGMIAATAPDTTAVRELFTQPMATPGANTNLDTYITNEVSRSDVWNWGHPPVITRATVRVRPYPPDYQKPAQSATDSDKVERPHPAAPLKFHIVEYSDRDLSQMQPAPMWTSTGYPDAEPLPSNWATHLGIMGNIRRPALYMPKTWVDPETQERYYPLGPVLVETEPKLASPAMRKCLLVSGDIVIPDVVSDKAVWEDTTGRTNQGAFFNLDTSQPGYAMLSTLWATTAMQNHKQVLQSLGMDPVTGKLVSPANWRGPVAVPTSYLEARRQSTTPGNNKTTASKQINSSYSNHEQEMWIYRPPPLPKKGKERTQYLLQYSAPSKQFVAILSDSQRLEAGGIATALSIPSNIDGRKGSKNSKRSKSGIAPINLQSMQKQQPQWQFQDWILNMGIPGRHTLPDVPIRVPNEQTNNLGLAWYGEPQRDSKYSVFAFLGIVPEGQIRHTASGRVFQFRHYGGPEPELYNIIVTTPTLRHIRKQDSKPYMVLVDTDSPASQVRFVDLDKGSSAAVAGQWRMHSVDPTSKQIIPFDVSRYSHAGESQSDESVTGQLVVLESVAKPGHVIAIKTRTDLTTNRWITGAPGNHELASRRPSGINLDGVYPEWQLLANMKRAGDMSAFILEPAA